MTVPAAPVHERPAFGQTAGAASTSSQGAQMPSQQLFAVCATCLTASQDQWERAIARHISHAHMHENYNTGSAIYIVVEISPAS